MAMPAYHIEPSPVEDARAALAAEIRSLMGRHKVSQTALAAELGMSQPALSKRLADRPRLPFSSDQLVLIARYFGVSYGDLVRFVWNPTLSLLSGSDEPIQGQLNFGPGLVLVGPDGE